MTRPDKITYYLDITKQVAQRGTCIRRKFGSIIVNNDQIISTGYAGAPRGSPNCSDLGKCLRKEQNIPGGERYELCRSVHAEANAIINAARAGVSTIGSTLFLSVAEDSDIDGIKPCRMCRRMIINAGIKKVIVRAKSGFSEHKPEDWVREDFEAEQRGDVSGY